MNHEVAGVLLRRPESRDAQALYAQCAEQHRSLPRLGSTPPSPFGRLACTSDFAPGCSRGLLGVLIVVTITEMEAVFALVTQLADCIARLVVVIDVGTG